MIQKSDYETIDSCVAHALKYGNHAAFAKYYFNRVAFRHELFLDKLMNLFNKREMLSAEDAYDLLKKFVLNHWKVQKPDYWNSYDTAFDREKDCFYGYSAKDSWLRTSVPSREAVVQLAFYLQLNLEETNQLLMAAGHEVLYVLNLLDAVCIFYLNYYQLEDNKKTPLENRLRSVKELVCQYAKNNKHIDENQIYISKISAKGQTSKKNNKKLVKDNVISIKMPDVVAYKSPIGKDIDERVERIRNLINQTQEHVSEQSYRKDDFYLTHLYNEVISSCNDPNDFESFILNNIFDYLPYGYLKKRNSMMKGRLYSKNLYKVSYPLIQNIDHVERIEEWVSNRTLNIDGRDSQRDRGLYNELKQSSFDDIEEKKYIKIMNGLWNRMDLEQDVKIKSVGERDVSRFFYGRNIATEKGQYKVKDQDVKDAFQFIVDDKKSYMKLCIVMGLEDELELFMCLGNYWTEGYWMKADKEKLEPLEALIWYALCYRDYLIEAWVERWKMIRKNSGKNATEFRNKIAEAFPFIHLLMLICRDIQLVMSVVDPKKTTVGHTRAMELLDTLIYPIGNTKKIKCGCAKAEQEDKRRTYQWYRDYCDWKEK